MTGLNFFISSKYILRRLQKFTRTRIMGLNMNYMQEIGECKHALTDIQLTLSCACSSPEFPSTSHPLFPRRFPTSLYSVSNYYVKLWKIFCVFYFVFRLILTWERSGLYCSKRSERTYKTRVIRLVITEVHTLLGSYQLVAPSEGRLESV